MEQFLEKLNKAKREVTFGLEHKKALKNVLTHRIEEDLVRFGLKERRLISERPTISSYFKSYLKPMPILKPVLIAILLFVLLSGGVSWAAEGALPGDLLYPVKVSVNERVRVALALGAEADAEWNVRQVERRLEEAEELAAKGQLNAQTRAEIEERFEAHINELDARLSEIHAEARPEVAARISANLERVLEVHAQTLAGTRGQATSTAMPVPGQEVDEMEVTGDENKDEDGESDAEVKTFFNTLMQARERVRVRARGLELEIESEAGPKANNDSNGQVIIEDVGEENDARPEDNDAETNADDNVETETNSGNSGNFVEPADGSPTHTETGVEIMY